MASHIYIAKCGSNSKNYAPTQFSQQIELTLENINKFLFGPNGLCCAPAHFSSEGRANKNYLDSDCMFVDIDCPPVNDAVEWVKQAQNKVAKIGLHVFAYPSFHHKVHLLIPFSRPIDSEKDCEKVISCILLKLKPIFPDLDTDCSDPARFSFEGAHVEHPESWSFECPGLPIDVDDILKDRYSARELHRAIFRKASALFQLLLLLASLCLIILVCCGMNLSLLQALSGLIASLSATAFNLFNILKRQ